MSERTGGVPLFVEEVTRLLLERGEQGDAQAIPLTLQQSLAARLDRLGSVREIAQIGAVLGRRILLRMLQSVAGLDESVLQASLDRLAEADILFVEGHGPQATYRFKHALIQDAAYDSLLKSRRQALHAQAAEILRDSASPEPEAIAHHFTQAGLDDLAIEWWGKAGDQALRRSAFKEAIAHLGKAIEMSEAGAGATEKPGAKLKLQVSYGNALMAARGYTSPETRVALESAREGWTGVEGVSERLSVYYGLWIVSHVRGELGAARELADAFFHDHKKSPDPGAASVANRLLGATKWFAGEFVEARAHLEKAVSIFDPERGTDLIVRFGHDIGISAIGYSAFALGHSVKLISLFGVRPVGGARRQTRPRSVRGCWISAVRAVRDAWSRCGARETLHPVYLTSLNNGPERIHPPPNHLIGDDYTALGEQVFDVTEANSPVE